VRRTRGLGQLGSRKTRLFAGITLVVVLGLLEVVSYLGCLYLQQKGVIYRPRRYEAYASYLASRDATLGWPAPGKFGHDGVHDATGSRLVPAFPDPTLHPSAVSLYGDSFTFGSEVDPEHSWANVLSTKIDARVANYGVPGYGSDQALLRFLGNRSDAAPVVFLNHLSENIMRNVNQYRHLLYPGEGVEFKPRFIIGEGGSLLTIPLPDFPQAQYPEVVRDPGRYLAHEYFLPGGSSGIQALRFPYTWTALRAFGNFHVVAELRGLPWWLEFYERDHPSDALSVTAAVLARFHEAVLQRGRTPIVAVIPAGPDLLIFREHGSWTYQPLLDALTSRGIDVLNFGDGLVQWLGSREPDVLFDDISRHFNEVGNRALADVAFAALAERQLL